MRDSDWQMWLEGLPTTRPELRELQTQVERQVVWAEAQLNTAIWHRDKREERVKRVELNDLNSKL
ncbi:hypothetical protein ACFFLM_06245 [Deinococcus oregonensis]|uniref:Uncharacterized protein n=1 Tax=Deinococcus oregonensis TaxID=1805970 RepID=A0ABV6AZF6_9DEIO